MDLRIAKARIKAHFRNGSGWWLDLGGCTGLTALPDGLTVGGRLDLSGCTGLTALPAGLTVGGWLGLSGCTGLTNIIRAGLDMRGYEFIGVRMADGWRVTAGCRNLTIPHAREHWRRNPECLALVEIIATQAGG